MAVWREHLQNELLKLDFNAQALGVLNALLLGDKRFLSNEIRSDFTNSGVIHILAVSGLHIGVVYFILIGLLKPLSDIKHGRLLQGILLILGIWLFALLTGLSTSVVRSATMFTFVVFARHFRSAKVLVLHSLVASFLLLLFVKPNWLFDVGFQLSYLAVLSIVLFQPLFESWLTPNHFILKYFWKLTTVSIAATLGTMPLVLYYFHQFSGLFLLSNIVVLPLLPFVLGIGIMALMMIELGGVFSPLVTLLNYLLLFINHSLAWVAQQEFFLFRNIMFTKTMLIVAFGCVIMLYFMMKTKQIRYMKYLSIGGLFFQIIMITNRWKSCNKNSFIVFHKTAQTIVGYREGSCLSLLHSGKIPSFIHDFKVNNYINQIDSISLNHNVLDFNGKLFLVVDSTAVYQNLNLTPYAVLLRQSPKIHLGNLIDKLKPKLIISDGSNYKSDVFLWRKTCAKYHTVFHYTGDQGVFILDN